jgi:UDP-N-acetylglucosamine acyltransferase
VFLKGMNNTKALEVVEANIPPSEERDYILNFIKTSDRGIMKGYGSGD